ncbi:MAG TPA: urate hydroxylase PuuD, partial [Pyrinomonadaceae bacterium]
IFGTIMAANVWMHILPSQRKMIAALNEGRKPDEQLSARAKLRSKQNTFMAVPVVFLMISNHFPGVTYGDRYNWIIVSVLVLAGWIAAKFIRRA